MVAIAAHGLEDFAEAFVVADVVADEVGGAHGLLRCSELPQTVMTSVAETERRSNWLLEVQPEPVPRLRCVILAIAPELHPLKQSGRPCQHRYALGLFDPVVPAFAAYLVLQKLRVLATPLTPMPPGTKRRGADHSRRAFPDFTS